MTEPAPLSAEDRRKRQRAWRRKCLRLRLGEPYWSRARAAWIIAGIDPDRSPTGVTRVQAVELVFDDEDDGPGVESVASVPRVYRGWGWLPYGFRRQWSGDRLDEHVEAEIAHVESLLRAKKGFSEVGDRPPSEWIKHARKMGYPIQWFAFAEEDEDCRKYLSLKTKQPSERSERNTENAQRRWTNDKKHQRIREIGYQIFEKHMNSGAAFSATAVAREIWDVIVTSHSREFPEADLENLRATVRRWKKEYRD